MHLALFISFQFLFQVFCCDGVGGLGDLLGGAGGDYFTAVAAAVWAEVDDVVGAFYHIHVVLDDDYGVAFSNESVEHAEQDFNVFEVQASSWLV